MTYNLYNSSLPSTNGESDNIIVIGILFEEFVKDDYSGVYVSFSDKEEDGKVFNTGDVIEDFKTGVKFAKTFNKRIILSSSVDNFIIDDTKYYFDRSSFSIVIREPRGGVK